MPYQAKQSRMAGPIVFKGIQYPANSHSCVFRENLSLMIPKDTNITALFVHELPPDLIRINVVIGFSCMFSFDVDALASAHATGTNLLHAIEVDRVAVIIPVADAYYMINSVEFVYNPVTIALQEQYEMVDETVEVPQLGEQCSIYTGNLNDSDIFKDHVVTGHHILYDYVETGRQVRVATEPVMVNCPSLLLHVSPKSSRPAYNIPFWQHLVLKSDDPCLSQIERNFRMTPVCHSSLHLAMSSSDRFRAKLVNSMRVGDGFAGKVFSFNETIVM